MRFYIVLIAVTLLSGCRGVSIICKPDGSIQSYSCDGAVNCPTIDEAKAMCSQMVKEQR